MVPNSPRIHNENLLWMLGAQTRAQAAHPGPAKGLHRVSASQAWRCQCSEEGRQRGLGAASGESVRGKVERTEWGWKPGRGRNI